MGALYPPAEPNALGDVTHLLNEKRIKPRRAAETHHGCSSASMTRPAAVSTVQVDNGRMRVTEWRFTPGAATGFHRHEYDYCVIPLTTGRLGIEMADKTMTEAQLQMGISYARKEGVELVFIEVELKEKARG